MRALMDRDRAQDRDPMQMLRDMLRVPAPGERKQVALDMALLAARSISLHNWDLAARQLQHAQRLVTALARTPRTEEDAQP